MSSRSHRVSNPEDRVVEEAQSVSCHTTFLTDISATSQPHRIPNAASEKAHNTITEDHIEYQDLLWLCSEYCCIRHTIIISRFDHFKMLFRRRGPVPMTCIGLDATNYMHEPASGHSSTKPRIFEQFLGRSKMSSPRIINTPIEYEHASI